MAAAEPRIDGSVSSPVLLGGGDFLPGSGESKRTDGGNEGVRQRGERESEVCKEEEPGARKSESSREDECGGRRNEEAEEESRGEQRGKVQDEWTRTEPDNRDEQKQRSPLGRREVGRWKDPDVRRCRGLSGDRR